MLRMRIIYSCYPTHGKNNEAIGEFENLKAKTRRLGVENYLANEVTS
jgi:hypothetical protein